ncbi:MAG: nicotinate-nucleotide adenylyltransferase [Gammaproteobacteria bacterium]|jgi:nicotinate-nucleotide adenylyltransferase|nr:nicotinate-nucleotide adenylyltransferase [Gammaproteobacteria bacterium]MDP6616756.1 nicotinate-nucleotide adenylyltransferase [Gammaproteobacteria bacterium]MDP6695179.1 nicotinate-nucleotide adenylyltransferase [Gammaproteobacteria bacterium]MDP7041480.1 nicotinate-nucleotide adenylyltransferase [Gammaproteobacteria bacterium]
MTVGQGPLAILGSAFDPVHYGHLRTAFELHEALQLDEVLFVPSGIPPRRESHVASGEIRLRMLEVAIEGLEWGSVDQRELRREGPSYSVLTLGELRQTHGDRSISMIIGMDAFLGLPGWHRWEELCDLAHLVVVHRPGWSGPEDGVLAELLQARHTRDMQALHSSPAGHIFVHEVTQLEISSSAIRTGIRAGIGPRYLVPDGVCNIIQQTGCYGGP